MLRKPLCFLFILTCAVGSAFSQGTSASSQSQELRPTTTIYSKTELVYVPVVVRDKDGKHVRGLTKDAFTVQQDGAPQTISVFEEVSGPRKERTAISVGDGFVTNVTPETNDRQLSVIVLDLMNTPVIRQGDAQRAVIQYLGNNALATHPIALFALTTSGLQQIYSFTEDPALLIRALQEFGSQSGGAADITAENQAEVDRLKAVEGAAAAGDAGMQSIVARLVAATKRGNVAYQVSTIRGTLASLEQLAGALAGVPGRKSVIWATAGFPFILDDPESFENRGTELMDDYARIWKLLNSASVAVYPVDVTGLNAVGMAGTGIYVTISGSRAHRCNR
ncbi:MAG: VWA domain-containing protein [Terriglobia bacterium]|nr:VWA domain-containing protein [Terriglobia bacterium]